MTQDEFGLVNSRLDKNTEPHHAINVLMNVFVFVCLIIAVSVTLATPAFAKDYLIEVVIFSQPESASQDLGSEELWANDRTLKKELDGKLRRPTTNSAVPEFFSPALLTNAAAAIRRQPGFDVLSHLGWRQSGMPRNESPLIRLPRNSSSADLEGWIRIYLNTFIFADIDLTLNNDQVGFNTRGIEITTTPPIPDSTNLLDTQTQQDQYTSPTTVTNNALFNNVPFRLKERRRVKFNEIHYFDHPRLGIILTVRPADA